MDSLQKLTLSWPIIAWLDNARWNKAALAFPVSGGVFSSLNPDGQLLTHWLCYITDQQRPYEEVWAVGKPIFAEIVQQCQSAGSTKEALDTLKEFTRPNPNDKKGNPRVDSFVSKLMDSKGTVASYTPRYGMHLVSIARTLALLTAYNNSIARYLASCTSFIFARSRSKDDSPTARMAFLLHLMSYAEVHRGMTSFHKQEEKFKEDVETASIAVQLIVEEDGRAEEKYSEWLSDRFHKRLWAAFRDYVKPGSYYQQVFISALQNSGADSILQMLRTQQEEILACLELPGDTWNIRFSHRLFDGKIDSPEALRDCYRNLRTQGLVSTEFYPEQFDVSFDFAPRMCDRHEDKLCPFKNGLLLKEYCHGIAGEGKSCPVIKIVCGYTTRCVPSGCPVLEGRMLDLCSGYS